MALAVLSNSPNEGPGTAPGSDLQHEATTWAVSSSATHACHACHLLLCFSNLLPVCPLGSDSGFYSPPSPNQCLLSPFLPSARKERSLLSPGYSL